MKKYLFTLVTLLAMTAGVYAQKFLDIYSNGEIVSSVKAADVDSLVVDNNKGKRILH